MGQIHTRRNASLPFSLSNALSTSFLLGGLQWPRPVKYKDTHARTHTRAGCGHVDLSAHRTRLDFQYGFVLQHSTLPVRPPVSVNVIRHVRLLPECCLSLFCFVFSSLSFAFFFHALPNQGARLL